MESQKFEQENKKIFLGMVIGVVVCTALMLLYMGGENGWHLATFQIIIALALGIVMGLLFGGLVVASWIANKKSIISLKAFFQIWGTGVVIALADFAFNWFTKSGSGSLSDMLFSTSTLWSFICGLFLGVICFKGKKK